MIYEAERAEDWQSFDIGKSELDETQDDDDNVEAVPAISEVRVESERQHLQHSFGREDGCEHLQDTITDVGMPIIIITVSK